MRSKKTTSGEVKSMESDLGISSLTAFAISPTLSLRLYLFMCVVHCFLPNCGSHHLQHLDYKCIQASDHPDQNL